MLAKRAISGTGCHTAGHRASIQNRSAVVVRSQTERASDIDATSRRAVLCGLSGILASTTLAAPAAQAAATAAKASEYLPPAGIDDLVLYIPDAKRTPVRYR